MRIVWTLAAVLSTAMVVSTQAIADKTCFELPIVIVSPTKEKLPTEVCNQQRYPAIDCMKTPVEANVEVVDHASHGEEGRLNCLHDTPTDVHLSKVHYRGQSSLHFSKHQMSVKFDRSESFLGFPEDKTYVLNGPVIDGSLIRNHLAHWLFRGTGRYSPRTRHAVVFIRDRLDPSDKTPTHKGIYLALEKIGYGPNRVNLATLDNTCRSDQLSGGWAWQNNPTNYGTYSPNIVMDQYQAMFGSGERPILMYPHANVMTQTMRDYFVASETGPLPRMYRSLYENMTHPEDMEKHLDLGSFADYFLHSEMSQNSDAYRRSAYFFKDRDQPINAGPVWDFNLAYGKGANQQDWLYKSHMFWRRLFCNYKFAALVPKRWRELRATVWSDASIQAFIKNSTAPIHRQLANCNDWTSINLQCANIQVGGSFQSNIDAVQHAALNRAKWMDENVAKFYSKLDGTVCAPVGRLPEYNCAADGTDDGCLTDPERYIETVEFPSLRAPFSGGSCSANDDGTVEFEKTSIDPCWLSAGVYMTEGSITPFCSGYGACPPGPGAVCTCIGDKKAPTCARSDDPIVSGSLQSSIPTDFTMGHSLMLSTLVGIAVCGVVVVVVRRMKQSKSSDQFPLAVDRTTATQYGT